MASGDGVIEYVDRQGVTHYRIQYRDADGRQTKETVGSELDGWTRRRAAEVRQERIVDVRRDGLRCPAGATFAEFAERFRLDHLPTRNLKRTTLKGWRLSLDRHLIPALGKYRLVELEQRPELIERFLGDLLKKGYAPKTVKNQLVNLKRMLNVAVRWRLIRSNPCNAVDPPRVPRFEPFILDEDAIASYLKAYRELEAAAEPEETVWWALARRMVTVALGSGLRRGELFGLRWSRVRLLEQTVTVREAWVLNAWDTPKSESSYRTVGLGPVAIAALSEQWETSRFLEDDDVVFAHPDLGTPLDPSAFTAAWVRPAMRKAGIPDSCRPWHDAGRHTSLTHDAAVLPQAVVQAKAGHSQPSVTARYVHLARVQVAGVAEASEGRLFSKLAAESGATDGATAESGAPDEKEKAPR